MNQDRCRHIDPHFPTSMWHNSTTSPDIAIANNHTFHNCRLQPGSMTSSDHILIIATISCNPLAILIKPRRQFRKADWDGYFNHLAKHDMPTETNPTLEEINSHLDDWTKLIQDATDKFIPTIGYRTPPGIKRLYKTNTNTLRRINQTYIRKRNLTWNLTANKRSEATTT